MALDPLSHTTLDLAYPVDPAMRPGDGHAGLPQPASAAIRTAARLRALFDLHVDGVLAVDPEGIVGEVNVAAAHLLEDTVEGIRGCAFVDLLAPDDRGRSAERLSAALQGLPQSWEADLAPADDVRRAVQLAAVPIVEADAIVGAFVVAHDVTSRRAVEAQLTYRAFHDPLTGLANRALFRDQLEQALARDPSGEHVAVIFVDLDDFKKVNDTQGHAAGDALLVRVAALLLESTRGCDLIARFGGDEFAVLLSRIAQSDHVSGVAARIAAALRRPIGLPMRAVVVGASLGIAHGRPGITADDLLRDADLAMYRAKASGKGNLAYAAGAQALVESRAVLHEDLRCALDGDPAGGRLSLAYQPVVELATGRIVTYEALARWWHPEHGEVPPATFVPLAEDTGLIVVLGRWVLRAACAQLRQWEAARPEGARPTVRVNISRCELEQPTLLRDVADALEQSGIAAGQLTLELSEASVMRRPDETLVTLHGLRELGVRLAIDNFGTAASSFGHLRRFPVDELKIDRNVLGGAPEDPDAEAVVRSMLALGRALQLRMVAEGIERPTQRAWLADVGCELGQGYLLAPPGAPDRVHGVSERPRPALADVDPATFAPE